VLANMVYERKAGGRMELFSGWQELYDTFELNQIYVPPCRLDMPSAHPCKALNETLRKCSEACPEKELLAARTARCNDERIALMKCLTKNKAFDKDWEHQQRMEEKKRQERPWWKLW
jgi:hypothetical protein